MGAIYSPGCPGWSEIEGGYLAGKILGFTERDLQDALTTPQEEWQRRFDRLRQREARNATQHWKRRLWSGLNPKKRGARWLHHPLYRP